MTFYLLFLHWMVSWNSKCLSFSFLNFSHGMQSVREACQNKKYSYRFSSFHTINNSFIDFVSILLGFPVGSAGKESGCNVEDLGSILGWKDPLEKGKATHSSVLAWRIPWTVSSMGLQRVGYDWATFTFIYILGLCIYIISCL